MAELWEYDKALTANPGSWHHQYITSTNWETAGESGEGILHVSNGFLHNTHTSAVTVSVRVSEAWNEAGETPDLNLGLIYFDYSLASNATLNLAFLKGAVLQTGCVIKVKASVANKVVCVVSGIKFEGE